LTRVEMNVAEPTLLQLPVLYYPGGVLRVRLDGGEVPFGNLGPYVALPLEPGRHFVTVWYAGVGWANLASGIGWAAVAIACVAPMVRAGRRRVSMTEGGAADLPRPGRAWGLSRRRRPAVSITLALLSVAVVAGILYALPAYRWWNQRRARGPALTVSASQSAEGSTAEDAFDGDAATEWVAPGGGPPVVLTVVPARPARLREMVLESRQTVLFESWLKVHVDLYRDGVNVGRQSFTLPEAATQPQVKMQLEPVLADKVELHFSSPVFVSRDGVTRVDPRKTNPGYREIRLSWD